MSGENRGSSNENQEQNALLRGVINDRLNGIIAELTDRKKKFLLRSLKQALEEHRKDTDARVPLTRFQQIFGRCGDTNAVVRFYDQYMDNPEIFTSVVSIRLELVLTDQRREERQRQQRMGEISRLLGRILNEATGEGAQVGYIVETLLYRAIENNPLSLDSFTEIVREGGRDDTVLQPQLANQFVDVFNRDLHESQEYLSGLHAEVERALGARGPAAIEPDAASVSSLSDDLGLHLSAGDSSSGARSQHTPWLGRYFNRGNPPDAV